MSIFFSTSTACVSPTRLDEPNHNRATVIEPEAGERKENMKGF